MLLVLSKTSEDGFEHVQIDDDDDSHICHEIGKQQVVCPDCVNHGTGGSFSFLVISWNGGTWLMMINISGHGSGKPLFEGKSSYMYFVHPAPLMWCLSMR